MFTGIVRYIGRVDRIESSLSGRRLRIDSPDAAGRLGIDDSISVAGVCLTVTARDEAGFDLDVVPETLSRTTLGLLRPGDQVNLEPAATLETALGGHLVQGHIDGATELIARETLGEGARLVFRVPSDLARYIVTKGFVALDGVSLTVASVSADRFEVALIPHTAEHTTMGALDVGCGFLDGRQ